QNRDDLQPLREQNGTCRLHVNFAGGKQRVVDEIANPHRSGVGKRAAHQGRLEVVEVDASQGLLDVQFARFAVQTDAVPVEYAIGGIRILLNFENDQSRADSVNASAPQKHGVAFVH